MNEFTKWCEAKGFNPAVVEANLECAPLPHTRSATQLIDEFQSSTDLAQLEMLKECEEVGRAREDVLGMFESRINDLSSDDEEDVYISNDWTPPENGWLKDSKGRKGEPSPFACPKCGALCVTIWNHQKHDGTDPVPSSCSECDYSEGVEGE
jgi:DNA-directed RNA polymerase subunit M/transcription elongation factor TFIIS